MKTESNPSKIRKKTEIFTLTTSIQQHTEVLEKRQLGKKKSILAQRRHYLFLVADGIFFYVEIPRIKKKKGLINMFSQFTEHKIGIKINYISRH